ncbi:MAG: DedA family protein [Armatimonadetes bacterium]|nr:DedA family protein [Armatimonadota bacterium]
MVSTIAARVSAFIIDVISAMGYAGVVLLMALESAGIPLPSEIIMPFSGYLALTGRFTLRGAALAGAAGCVLGGLGAYWVARVGGRSVLERYGRYLLISKHDLDVAERWFLRYADPVAFIGRLLPVIRTYISFPAGMAGMDLRRFILYSFLGSWIWTYWLAWVGWKLGERWDSLRHTFEKFDVAIAVLLVAGAAWWVRRHLGRDS